MVTPATAQKAATPASFTAAVLNDAERSAAQISDLAGRTEAQFDLARAFLFAGDGEGAARAYRVALETLAKIVDAHARGRLLANHAGIVAQMPMASRPALRRLAALRAQSVPADSGILPRLAEEQAGDDLTEALHTAARLANPIDRDRALSAIAQRRGEVGDTAGAIRTAGTLRAQPGGLTAAQNQALTLTALIRDRKRGPKERQIEAVIYSQPLSALTTRLREEKNALTARVLCDIAETLPSPWGGNPKRWDSAYRAATRQKPPDYGVLVRLAALAVARGDASGAARALDALRPAPDAARLTQDAFRAAIEAAKPGEDGEPLLTTLRRAAPVLGDASPEMAAELLRRVERFDEAQIEAERIADSERAAVALLTLAEKQIDVNEFGGAKRALNAAATATERIPDERQRGLSRERVARLRARAGDIAGAVEGAKAITDPKSAAGAYSDILFEQLTATDYTGAQRTALGIPNAHLRDRMLVNIAAWQVKADNKGFPYRFVDEDYPLWVAGDKPRNADIPAAQQTAGFIADPSYRSAALCLIAQTQLALNNREGATRTALLIPDDAARAGTLAALASSRDAAGDWAGAEEAARQITTIEGKIFYLTARAGRKARTGDIAGARADYTTAADMAAEQGTPDRLAPLQASAGKMTVALDISRRFFDKTGDREIFLNVWEAYLQRPRFPKEPLMLLDALAVTNYLRDETLRRVTEWAANRKDFVTATAVATRIGDASHRLSAYLTLVREEGGRNKTASLPALQQARAAALSLHEPDPRFRALLSVADASLPQR